jgi:hypothetical protein
MSKVISILGVPFSNPHREFSRVRRSFVLDSRRLLNDSSVDIDESKKDKVDSSADIDESKKDKFDSGGEIGEPKTWTSLTDIIV